MQGTNLRAAQPIGAGDVHFIAPSFLWEACPSQKMLSQMLLNLNGANFYVHKIRIEPQSFPESSSEKYFASLICNKIQSQAKIKTTAMDWVWIWMFISESVVQEDLQLRFLIWLTAEERYLGLQLETQHKGESEKTYSKT